MPDFWLGTFVLCLWNYKFLHLAFTCQLFVHLPFLLWILSFYLQLQTSHSYTYRTTQTKTLFAWLRLRRAGGGSPTIKQGVCLKLLRMVCGVN